MIYVYKEINFKSVKIFFKIQFIPPYKIVFFPLEPSSAVITIIIIDNKLNNYLVSQFLYKVHCFYRKTLF